MGGWGCTPSGLGPSPDYSDEPVDAVTHPDEGPVNDASSDSGDAFLHDILQEILDAIPDQFADKYTPSDKGPEAELDAWQELECGYCDAETNKDIECEDTYTDSETGPTDTDGDGIPDVTDNCIEISNSDQKDTDDDGIGDKCDVEECDGLDNNGNGTIDDGFNIGDCTAGIGECLKNGLIQCAGLNESACSAIPGDPEIEECDGKDNDCDNVTDEIAPDSIVVDSDGNGICDEMEPYADIDNDGIMNEIDNCVSVFNPDQLDNDEDGIGDKCDTEECDGIDNNGNNLIDEIFLDLDKECPVGQGICQSIGTFICSENKLSVKCDAVAGNPEIEECDGFDNDCDGQTDENLGQIPISCGLGECLAFGLETCVGGFWQDSCAPKQPSIEICDGKDNDCDEITDEGCECIPGTYVSITTYCGDGACATTGSTYCDINQVKDSCVPPLPSKKDDSCNGFDDDCDKLVDEHFVYSGPPITCGIGACMANGTKICMSGQLQVECTPKPPSNETCDLKDNDCDGATDEGLNSAIGCGVGECAVMGVKSCVNGQWSESCTPGPPTSETCDGKDNDCDTKVDEDSVCDVDQDGIPNYLDNCPNVANPLQTNNYGGPAGDACEDTDNDTVLDAVDNCPTTPNQNQANNYGTTLGDLCDCTINNPTSKKLGAKCKDLSLNACWNALTAGGLSPGSSIAASITYYNQGVSIPNDVITVNYIETTDPYIGYSPCGAGAPPANISCTTGLVLDTIQLNGKKFTWKTADNKVRLSFDKTTTPKNASMLIFYEAPPLKCYLMYNNAP